MAEMAERATLDGAETPEAGGWEECDKSGGKTAALADSAAEALAADDGGKKDTGDEKHGEEPKEYVPKETEPPQVK